MNMKKLIAAHREYGRLMAGRRYEDMPPRTQSNATEQRKNVDKKVKTCYALEHQKI